MRVLFAGLTTLTGRSLKRELERSGWIIDVVSSDSVLTSLVAHHYDAVAVEAKTPDEATHCVSLIRATGNAVPLVIVCSGDRPKRTAVAGLDAGADAYVSDPDTAELSAVTRAVARRTLERRPAVLVVGDLRLDPGAHVVTRRGQPIDLTTREFTLLEFLMRNAGLVVSRSAILDAVWGLDYVGASNVVDVYIGYLRRKIDKPFGTAMLVSVRGVGYKLEESSSEPPNGTTQRMIDLRETRRSIGA